MTSSKKSFEKVVGFQKSPLKKLFAGECVFYCGVCDSGGSLFGIVVVKGRDDMVEPIIFERVDTRTLKLNQRVVCFYPEDDYPHFGQVCDCGFEMPDGIVYFGVTSATSGNWMFPILETRCYQPVEGPFEARGEIEVGDVVCINDSHWGEVQALIPQERVLADGRSILTWAGIVLFRGWYNGAQVVNREAMGMEDLRYSAAFVPWETIASLQRVEGLRCAVSGVPIQEKALVSVNQGAFRGWVEAILFPDSPLAEIVGVEAPFTLVLRTVQGRIEMLSSAQCQDIRRCFFGHYSDTCATIQYGERVAICKYEAYAPALRVEGIVESILPPYSQEAKVLQAFATGGLMVKEDSGERVFVAWCDGMEVVRQ